MAHILSFIISSGSKKKEPRYVCLSEAAQASHSCKMWTEVSSSVPHFLQLGLLLSPITCKCLLKVLCPVSRPITTLDGILLKDNNRALVARSGPEINSPACCLCTTRTMPQYQTLFFHPVFHLSYILPRDPQERLMSNKPLNRTVPCEVVSDFISSHSGMSRDPV